jgi:hypothetical protein
MCSHPFCFRDLSSEGHWEGWIRIILRLVSLSFPFPSFRLFDPDEIKESYHLYGIKTWIGTLERESYPTPYGPRVNFSRCQSCNPRSGILCQTLVVECPRGLNSWNERLESRAEPGRIKWAPSISGTLLVMGCGDGSWVIHGRWFHRRMTHLGCAPC